MEKLLQRLVTDTQSCPPPVVSPPAVADPGGGGGGARLSGQWTRSALGPRSGNSIDCFPTTDDN